MWGWALAPFNFPLFFLFPLSPPQSYRHRVAKATAQNDELKKLVEALFTAGGGGAVRPLCVFFPRNECSLSAQTNVCSLSDQELKKLVEALFAVGGNGAVCTRAEDASNFVFFFFPRNVCSPCPFRTRLWGYRGGAHLCIRRCACVEHR